MVTRLVTSGSESAKSGRYVVTGSDQDTSFLVTAAETHVLPTDFDTDASWKTVSASTLASLPSSRTPNPFA